MRTGAGHRVFLLVAALGFFATAAVTISWCASMASMPGMPMPGGWRMSMAWMRMPGQGWTSAGASFTGMWAVMMMAMMLPVLAPMLLRYRRAIPPGQRAAMATWQVAAGYFGVWTAAGALAWPVGVALAELAMRSITVARAAPLAAALLVMIAGALQLSAWKSRQLARCRDTIDCCRSPEVTAGAAWRHGIALGIRCLRCCAPLTLTLFVMGVMDLGAMALVGFAIGIERLVPQGERAARLIGVVMICGGWSAVMRVIA